MALSIVDTLQAHGEVNQTFLAKSFGRRYDISRGYFHNRQHAPDRFVSVQIALVL
jgi:hypothetical protein